MALVIALGITALLYGAAPLILATVSKTPTTKNKYMWTCYGINFALALLLQISSGTESFNFVPALIWTQVFFKLGLKKLTEKQLLVDAVQVEQPAQTGTCANPLLFCRKCGAPRPDNGRFCRQCGTDFTAIRFCTACGAPLEEGQKFCTHCGTAQTPPQ